VASAFRTFTGKAAHTATSVASGVVHLADGARDAGRSANRAAKEAGRRVIAGGTERSVDWALRKSGKSIKSSLVDDEMPGFVRAVYEATFDAVWPDVAHEIKANVLEAVNEKLDGGNNLVLREPRQVRGAAKYRAWFLYAFQPYDLSTFQALRRPSTALLALWSSFTYMGVQFTFWLAMFLLMDKRDEYTLINFILSFKALQFLTLGFGGLLIGAAQYHWCLTGSLDHHTCDTSGPGSGRFFYLTIGGFYAQSVLAWLAFALLPYSRRKGGSQLRAEDEEAADEDDDLLDRDRPQEYRSDAGGYLPRLMFYDLAIFSGIAAWVCYYGSRPGALAGHDFHWQFRATLYWTKTTYGLLSLPFLAFVVPPFNSIFTHAVPTGYDQAGDVVRVLSARQRKLKQAAALGLKVKGKKVKPKPVANPV